MTDSLKTVNTRKTAGAGTKTTAQTAKAVKGQKKNNAGGFVFKISDVDRAKRFLILGSESNFYTPGAKLSAENAKVLIKLASKSVESSKELVDLTVEVSTEGRAVKVNPALFSLAIAASHGEQEAQAYALSKLPEVARTGTHLFLFAAYVEQFRGWGKALQRAVATWYTDKDVDKVAYQAVKYQSRDGWSHRDLFRLTKPASARMDPTSVWQDPAYSGLAEWITKGDSTNAPKIVKGFIEAQSADLKDLPKLIKEYGLSWEMLPTQSLNEVAVWEALLDGNVPMGALIRQLPRLTRIGVIKPMGETAVKIANRLKDADQLSRARIHPIDILTAAKVYNLGRSVKGDGTWTPHEAISAALDKAFYLAFKAVEPAGKRTLIGLDVSGSMDWGGINGSVLTPREATAAIALVTVSTEPSTHVIGFTGGAGRSYGYGGRASSAGAGAHGKVVTNLDTTVSDSRRLDDVIRDLERLPMGSTDCALPMLYALEEGLEVDTFIVMTDNETYAGSVHPFQALKQYREKTGIDAKLIVMSTDASKFSIADPDDAGMLDIAGFDSAAPAIVANFSRGL